MFLVGVLLIAVGAFAVLAGELIGVFSNRSNDTITEWFVWLRNKSKWTAFILAVIGVGVLLWHFAVS